VDLHPRGAGEKEPKIPFSIPGKTGSSISSNRIRLLPLIAEQPYGRGEACCRRSNRDARPHLICLADSVKARRRALVPACFAENRSCRCPEPRAAKMFTPFSPRSAPPRSRRECKVPRPAPRGAKIRPCHDANPDAGKKGVSKMSLRLRERRSSHKVGQRERPEAAQSGTNCNRPETK